MEKFIIPSILAATILVAGMFSFIPVQQATTVHTTIGSATADLTCVTETVTATQALDNDDLTITFDNDAIEVLRLGVTLTDNADQLGIDADPTVNGAVIQTVAIADNAAPFISDEGLEVLSAMKTTSMSVTSGGAISWTWDGDGGADVENGDVITFQICGLVQNAGAFDATDITITGTGVGE